MTSNDRPRVEDYLPEETSDNRQADIPAAGRLWNLVRKFGIAFNLVLLVALAFQIFVAVFIALNGLKTLPLLASNPPTNQSGQFFPNAVAIVLAILLQGLLLTEIFLAIRLRPDASDQALNLDWQLSQSNSPKEKSSLVDPPYRNIWWGVTLAALFVTGIIDLGLLFLSLTGKTTLGGAWQSYGNTPTLGFIFLPLAILNFLTLFCGAILGHAASTRTSDDEDGFKAFAEAFLVGASGRLRAKVIKVWRRLGVDPLRFIPINPSVMKLLASKHPEYVPSQAANGETWAYDFSSNMFALLSEDVHKALLQNIYKLGKDGEDIFDTDGNRLLWRLSTGDIADMIARNMEIYGQPRFVDIRNPNKPKTLTDFSGLNRRPANKARSLPQLTAPGENPVIDDFEPVIASQYISPNMAFALGLSKDEKALFGSYLTNTVFPHARGNRFPAELPDMSIFEAFDLEDMLWYYRYWKKQAGSRA